MSKYGIGSGGGASNPGTPALTLSTTNSQGAASTLVATDATIAAFDATVPVTQAFGDAAAAGSAGVAARRDHKHGMPASPTAAAIVQVKTAVSTTDDITTAVTMQDSSLSLTFTPLFSDSILHVTVDGECVANRVAGSPTLRIMWVGILNSTNSSELVRQVRGGNLVSASTSAADYFMAIALKGIYTVNSTAARTFKLQFMSGEVTNVQAALSGTRTGGVRMTIMEVRP